MKSNDGFNSTVCTWSRCRVRLEAGDGVQVVIDGEDHRLCTEHNTEYMDGYGPEKPSPEEIRGDELWDKGFHLNRA